MNAFYYKYDPTKARSLINEVGFEGATIEIKAIKESYVLGAEIAQAIFEMMKKVGLRPDLEIVGDWLAYVANMKKREHNMALLGWAPASFVTDGALSSLYL